MAAGNLKMWNADRGFGFITALRGIDPDNLGLGERLTFDVERDARSGRIKAANVRRPG